MSSRCGDIVYRARQAARYYYGHYEPEYYWYYRDYYEHLCQDIYSRLHCSQRWIYEKICVRIHRCADHARHAALIISCMWAAVVWAGAIVQNGRVYHSFWRVRIIVLWRKLDYSVAWRTLSEAFLQKLAVVRACKLTHPVARIGGRCFKYYGISRLYLYIYVRTARESHYSVEKRLCAVAIFYSSGNVFKLMTLHTLVKCLHEKYLQKP